jgi:RimJ/RimL family protein N-acetyltransferase
VTCFEHNGSALCDIHTERLDIHPLSECDETLFCELFTDPDTMRYIGPQLPLDRAARSFRKAVALTRCRPEQRLFFTVALRSAQQKIGICSLQQIDPIRRRAEAGVVLKSFARAQGYAREILRALVARAFATLPVDEIWLQYSAEHSLAERLFVAAGFSRRLDPAAYGEGPDKRVWSAHRGSWSESVPGIQSTQWSASRQGTNDPPKAGSHNFTGDRSDGKCHAEAGDKPGVRGFHDHSDQ